MKLPTLRHPELDSGSQSDIRSRMLKAAKILFKSTLLCPALVLFSCGDEPKKEVVLEKEKTPSVPSIEYTVVKTYPHDTMAFTEGFVFYKGQLFESTGAPDNLPKTRSLFGICDLNTGKIDVKAELDRSKYFGEGIVFFNDKIYQLTYKNQTGFIYDAKTFKKTGEFKYDNKEGWGLTTDGTNLIMSDGTNVLTYLDPNTLKPVKTLTVTEGGYASDYLNELEYIKGFIYANVWTTHSIVKIDPATGKIVGKLLLSPLYEEAGYKYKGAEALNGIAYDPETDKIYITGKMWPTIYEITFAH